MEPGLKTAPSAKVAERIDLEAARIYLPITAESERLPPQMSSLGNVLSSQHITGQDLNSLNCPFAVCTTR